MTKYQYNRPEVYKYFDELHRHLGGDMTKVFNGELIYPRQLEIHLPGNGKIPCNFNCAHCQGRIMDRSLGKWEEDCTWILEQLKGAIPYHIYGGAYTEPLLNDYLLFMLRLTKKYGNSFGIHTNGSLLLKREWGRDEEEFVTTMIKLADGERDYLSISLDAGSNESHKIIKRTTEDKWFDVITTGLECFVRIRKSLEKNNPKLRVVYLLLEQNANKKEVETVVNIMKRIGGDSVRFSIPYDVYGKDFKEVRDYKQRVELAKKHEYYKLIEPYLSTTKDEKPFVFWIPPEYQDVDQLNYTQCIFDYFQITFGADGYMYKCSAIASPTFKECRLGKITNDIDEFNKMVMKNHNPNFNPRICFSRGGRCNRMAIEINNIWRDEYEKTYCAS